MDTSKIEECPRCGTKALMRKDDTNPDWECQECGYELEIRSPQFSDFENEFINNMMKWEASQ